MCAKSLVRPIIKRKRIIAADEGHGGQWKVAYADFVTAMMAFFLIMWLLNATTERQRKGLADYFSPTIQVARTSAGGSDAFAGDSTFAEDTLARSAEGGSFGQATSRAADPDSTAEADGSESFKSVAEMLSAYSGESMASDRALRHIVTRVTDEGLIVEIFDLPGEPLFDPDSDSPTPVTVEIASVLARVFSLVGNRIAVTGHVRSYPVVLAVQPAWPLSWQRGTRLRELIEGGGLPGARFVRVTGKADRDQIAADPAAVRNNRVEVTLLRRNRT